MRSGKTNRYQKIPDFFPTGNYAAIGNRIRFETTDFDISLILYKAIDNVSVTIMRIHSISSPTNAIVTCLLSDTMLLSHHHFSKHSARLTNIQLM